MSRAALVAVSLALAVATPARAEGQRNVLTERAALDRARRENLELLAAKHRVSAARANVVAAGVWPNPTVAANGLLLTHGAVTGGREEVVVSVGQTLPVGGQVGLRKDVARGQLDAEEKAFEASAWRLVNEVRLAYLEVQRAQARLRIARAALADIGRVEAIVEARASGGAAPVYDRHRVAVERSKLDGRAVDAEVALASARASLAVAVGRGLDTRGLTVEELRAGDEPSPDAAVLAKRALAQRPDVASARARVTASERQITLARRQFVPSPTVSLGYGRYIDIPDSAGLSGGAVVLGLSLPVPLLDRGQGTVARGRAEAAEERSRSEALALGVEREVEEAAVVYELRAAAWRRFRDGTTADVERMRTIAELSYREGRSTVIELLDAYASYMDAQERRVDLEVAALAAGVSLAQAVGPGGLR